MTLKESVDTEKCQRMIVTIKNILKHTSTERRRKVKKE
jgi:hypothetical protein